MGMSLVTIVIAVVAIAIAWKILAGMIKIGVIVLVLAVAAYLLSQGMI